MKCTDVVLVGAGLASQRCAETLRARGFDGPIRMIGAEEHPPYDRPPLSKEFLGGAPEEVAVAPPEEGAPAAAVPLLRPLDWHAEQDVDLFLGDAAVALEDRRVRLASGATVPIGTLVVAT